MAVPSFINPAGMENRLPGVPRAIRETVFQPFVKAEGAASVGLGLTIARRVAREHGGEAYLEDSQPGRTVFVLTLPKSLFCSLTLNTRSNAV